MVACTDSAIKGQPRGSTLAVRAEVNPTWDEQIVTLGLDGAPAGADLLLRAVLCEQVSSSRE